MTDISKQNILPFNAAKANMNYSFEIFPPVKYIIVEDAQINIRKFSCPICLKNIKIPSKPDNCNHLFCKKCLEKWSNLRKQCPLCRERFTYIIKQI